MSTPRTGPAGFWWWLVGGAVLTFLGLSLPSALLVGFPLAAVVAAVLSWRSWLPGYLLGTSLPLLWVAWENRGGPGFVTFRTDAGGGGHELLDPVPWLLVGLALVLLAAVLLTLGRWRRTSTAD
ncbi:hypothetical protein [Ornithinimicrobium avium]|uniref:Apolipoprotein N-acyltransferase n=1 Tax=Ornithinimicrobium avium TaxID=2283195 RepID=A0A345NN62_9MICO|nr:hypothetical protein [Ornithinimicrobium avium]AXH96470.1 hypothetical protein DV701_10355 [Ornithinimicrobium avium]